MEDSIDPCSASGRRSKRKGRKAYSPQKRSQLLKKISEKWNQSRIYLGRAKERWNKLKQKYKFQTDYELAEFLMDSCDVDLTIPDLEPVVTRKQTIVVEKRQEQIEKSGEGNCHDSGGVLLLQSGPEQEGSFLTSTPSKFRQSEQASGS
eukprot:Seg1415.6 transcript_id=Seg1415.6/GoldUCD/mRNA.D3Y31 product="hypothetical protein" protein_id=Seg1415.6/GoldUCD/D3Y31